MVGQGGEFLCALIGSSLLAPRPSRGLKLLVDFRATDSSTLKDETTRKATMAIACPRSTVPLSRRVASFARRQAAGIP
jgi:hypothetical protein